MEGSFIVTKRSLQLQVAIYGTTFKIQPLVIGLIRKEVLYSILTSIETMAGFYRNQHQGKTCNLYTTLLLYFNNEGWLIREVDPYTLASPENDI